MTLEEFQKRIAALPPEKLEAMLIRCRQEGPAEALPLLVAEQIRRRAASAGATVETGAAPSASVSPAEPKAPPQADRMPPAPGKQPTQKPAETPPPKRPEPKSGFPKVIPQPDGPWGMAYKGAFAAVFALGALRLLLRVLRR